ncbi:MAG TPA: endo-1,4-beta-xylanase [Anaerolineae bacterium]|jgi:GH35 family endo-1,4-beta-xylanase
MPTLTFDINLPAGIELRSVYLTDMGRRPVRTRVERGRWLRLESNARGPYIVRAVIGSAAGDLDVVIDNNDEGYLPGDAAPNLLIEAIASRLWRCERRMKNAGLSDRDFDALTSARESFARGDFTTAFLQAIRAGDDIEYAASRKVLLARGRSALFSGSITFGERLGQWSIGVGPDWPISAPPPAFTRPVAERETLLPVCEAMTLPNFWRWIEPVQWKYRWDVLDEMLNWAEAHKLVTKSFAIFWLGIGSTPRWLRDLSFREQLNAIEQWTRALVGRYRGRVAAWETVNENHDWSFGNPFSWSRYQRLQVTRLVNDVVGEIDPGTPRIINNCCIWGEYAASADRRTSWLPVDLPPAVDSPLSFIEYLNDRNVAFEGIGLQYYLPGRDLMECAEQLDRYLAFGKDIWITEMGTPGRVTTVKQVETGQTTPGAGWRGEWSEALQADWVRMWYTIASARKGVRALNYWDLDDSRAFIEGAGVVDHNGTPKQAFGEITRLRGEFALKSTSK